MKANCIQCQTGFDLSSSQKKQLKADNDCKLFCSLMCRKIYFRELRRIPCAWCKKEFIASPTQICYAKKKPSAKTFCSHACASKWRSRFINPTAKRKLWLNKEELYDLYYNQHLTTIQIATKYQVAHSTVWENLKRLNIPIKPRIGKHEFIPELNHFSRSSWEKSTALWLKKKHYTYFYEPKVFNTANGYYRPDFYLPDRNIYIEVKGRWYRDAKEKFLHFWQRHPNVLLLMEHEIDLINQDIANEKPVSLRTLKRLSKENIENLIQCKLF